MSEKIARAAEVENLLLTGEAATVFTVYWRPIETAPKDGTRILILEEGVYHRIVFWATFYSPFYRGEIEGWWTGSFPGSDVTLPRDATHWMPLPEPPEEATS